MAFFYSHRLFFIGLGIALLLGCSDDSEMADTLLVPEVSSVTFDMDGLPDFRRIHSAGSYVYLGTVDEEFKPNERPRMKVNFTYDFSIGEHEVTCDEYNGLFERTDFPLKADCEGNIPVTDVSYFDAILYANAKSKLAERDTFYSYSKVSFDEDDHVQNIEGLSFNPESEGFRLPTEAEWVLAASQGWQTKFAWTASNSDYKLHEVCSVPPNAAGICDMVGNAMEWVNDWLGNFRDTVITNYVGSPDGGSIGERVVKGGSFRNSESSINLVSRGDVYSVTSATRANYVGFRLAYGSIPDAVWMNYAGKSSTSILKLPAGSEKIFSLTGSYKTKLAFRNDLTGNLVFIDYVSRILASVEIVDTLDVYHPDISPDGKKVAFCTGLEGVDGKSSVYVRDLNSTGSNLVRLNVDSAAIPRWRVLDNGDTAIVYVTGAGNNSEESKFKKQSTWQAAFKGGSFGTPQKLFDGAYHGGISADNRLAVSGARLLRARMADSTSTLTENAVDTVWYGGEQACNASLANDGSKRTLFLDFGGKTGRDFVGKSYDTHERLLVVDSTGTLAQSVAAPAGYTFDHSEWALNVLDSIGGLVVATLMTENGSHSKIVAVNLKDSNIVDLVEGDELWHPCLWRYPKSISHDDAVIDLDSAGAYLSAGFDDQQARFRLKMERFWKMLPYTEVFLAGSSRMELGMNPDLYPEKNMLNFAVEGIDLERDFYFIKNYCLKHGERIKVIAFSVDLDDWRGNNKFLRHIVMSGPGYTFDANHNFWQDGIPTGFVSMVEKFPTPPGMEDLYSDRGNEYSESASWDCLGADILADTVFSARERQYLDSRIEEIKRLADTCAARKIHLIGIVFPQSPAYKSTGSFGLYAIQRSVAKEKLDELKAFSKQNLYFHLMDENKMGNHDYTDEMARNRDHLSSIGAAQMTKRFVQLLDSL